MTIKHSGILEYVEESDLSYYTYLSSNSTVTYLEDDKIDWNVARTDLVFKSLQKVLFRIRLKDRSSKRRFILTKMVYNYNNNLKWVTLFDRDGKKRSNSLKKFEWNT